MSPRYEIKYPVRYDRINYRILDTENKVVCRPWQITGMTHQDVHERGEFLVIAINKNKPEDQKTVIEKVEDKIEEKTNQIKEGIESVKDIGSSLGLIKKRGRPSKTK